MLARALSVAVASRAHDKILRLLDMQVARLPIGYVRLATNRVTGQARPARV